MPRLIFFGITSLVSLAPCVFAQPAAPGDDLKPLMAPGRSTLKGRVVWKGALPDIAALDKELMNAFQRRIPKELWPKGGGGLEQQVWRISPTGGVGNVVIFLIPPPGFYFPMDKTDLDPEKARWKKEVVLEASDFAFRPHLVTLFPKGRDVDGKTVQTGQAFKIRTDGKVVYNAALNGPPDFPGFNAILPPGKEVDVAVPPTRMPVAVQCNIYPWMRAWVRAFDHPYAVVTDGDGYFEVRNVPAGVKVQVQAWHEQIGWLSPNGRAGDTILVPMEKTYEHTFSARRRE
jgi:hypothetical protein